MKKDYRAWKSEKNNQNKYGNKYNGNLSVKIDKINTIIDGKDGDILFASSLGNAHWW